MTMYVREPIGVIIPSGLAPISLVAALTPVILYTPLAGQRVRINKLHVANRNGADTQLQIGRNVGGFVQIYPNIIILAGMDDEITEDRLIRYWWGTINAAPPDPIVIQATVAAAAPADVQIYGELEVTES